MMLTDCLLGRNWWWPTEFSFQPDASATWFAAAETLASAPSPDGPRSRISGHEPVAFRQDRKDLPGLGCSRQTVMDQRGRSAKSIHAGSVSIPGVAEEFGGDGTSSRSDGSLTTRPVRIIVDVSP